MKKTVGIHIDGHIYSDDKNIGHSEFLDAFIKFIESKGWNFGGMTYQVDEEGNNVDDID